MSSRKRSNSIISINVNGVQVEGVNDIREAVFLHFQNHFKEGDELCPGMSNLPFKSFSVLEGVNLIKPFL